MEKTVTITLTKRLQLEGTLNTASRQSKKLIIFVHGLTGHQNEHIFYNAVPFFTKKGFNTFRFDYYDNDPTARTLTQSTLTTHIHDLNKIIDYWAKRYAKVYIVGHSLGGLTVLLSNTKKANAIICWDPSVKDSKNGLVALHKHMRFVKSLNAYVFNWGVEFLIGKKMFQDWQNASAPKEVMQNVSAPIKIINAGTDKMATGGKEYYQYASKPKAYTVIKQAGHTFDEPGAEQKLFQETYRWIKKY